MNIIVIYEEASHPVNKPEIFTWSVEKTYPMFSRPMTAEKFISEELPANVKA